MLVSYIKRRILFFHNLFSKSSKLRYIHEDARGYKGLQAVTTGYNGLQGVTRGYRGLKGVTRGCKGLQGATRG